MQYKIMWKLLLKWLNDIFNQSLKLDPGLVLFGIVENMDEETPVIVWLILLVVVAKKHIWACRNTGGPLTIQGCLAKVRDTENLEAHMALRNNRIVEHVEKWAP